MNLFLNAGQTCVAPTRVFVQSGIYDEFVKRSVEMASKVKVGSPFDADVFQGPQVKQPLTMKTFIKLFLKIIFFQNRLTQKFLIVLCH